jgi:pyruvate dehydrogenase E1 component alpha subunit
MKSKSKKKLEQQKSNKINYDIDLLKTLHKKMLMIRRFEEKAGQLYGMGHIGGFCHLYIGQEAVVVGIQSILDKNDTLVTSYRDHGHMLACDMDPKGVMAELTGRATGYSKGKGGSMHMFSREKGFFGGHGIVAAQVPIGAGLAFAHKYNSNNAISVTFFGDGAANQGQVYETYNMASLWKLPVIFVIENNMYGMGTSVSRSSAGDNFAKRGDAFGIKNKVVNGMDVLEVREAAKEAVKYCRSGNGPYILEVKTYRYRGHSMSDPAKYRSREEVEDARRTGPIKTIQNLIVGAGIKEEELKSVDDEIRKIVNEAAEFALESDLPSEDELFKDITIN